MIEKFLFQPVKPWRVSQGFGENKACIDLSTGKVTAKNPYLDSTVCPPGTISVYSSMLGHNGIDVAGFRWQRVYAAHSGIVTEVETEEARGLGVSIVSDKPWYCQETGKKEYFKSRYWHFIATDVHFGDKVEVGDLIGYVDSTGYSSGDHLHFELKPVAISDYENGVPVVYNVLQKNGYYGAIDPNPYLEPIFSLEFAGLWKQVREFTAVLSDWLSDKLRNK